MRRSRIFSLRFGLNSCFFLFENARCQSVAFSRSKLILTQKSKKATPSTQRTQFIHHLLVPFLELPTLHIRSPVLLTFYLPALFFNARVSFLPWVSQDLFFSSTFSSSSSSSLYALVLCLDYLPYLPYLYPSFRSTCFLDSQLNPRQQAEHVTPRNKSP